MEHVSILLQSLYDKEKRQQATLEVTQEQIREIQDLQNKKGPGK